MIVVHIELWPKGDESRKRELGVGRITNVGGDRRRGNYKVALLKSPEYAKSEGIWRRGLVSNFPRFAPFGPWDLLLLALHAALGKQRVFRLLKETSGATDADLVDDDDDDSLAEAEA
jgi:hypothetical protein